MSPSWNAWAVAHPLVGLLPVAAAFVAVVFVTSELAANVLSERWGLLGGVAAAGVLVFALAPLQRFAERLSDTAMPNVRESDSEYVRLRKVDVYRAALEGAAADGSVSAREGEMLTRLQLELGISNAEARAIEAELKGTPGGD